MVENWTDFIIAVYPEDSCELTKIGEFYVNKTFKRYYNFLLFVKGYLLNIKNLYQFCKNLFNNPKQTLSKLDGEFALACIDTSSGRIILATDKIGAIKLYCDLSSLIFSSNFWWIIKTTKKDTLKFDKKAIKELIFFHQPLFGKSIFVNHRILEPGEYVIIDTKSELIERDYYYDFKFKYKIEDIEYALTLLDHSIDKIISIVTKHYKNCTFGVGISGGLDSRIIPHYLLKYTNNIRAFIIGKSKPHKLLLSLDHSNAHKISKYYNLPLDIIEYDSEDIFKKALLDLKSNPLCTSNILKATFYDKIDVLITGGYGMIVGGHVLNKEIEEYTVTELTNKIADTFSILKMIKGYSLTELPRALYCIITQKNRNSYITIEELPGLIKKHELRSIKKDIMNFVRNEHNKGKCNYSIFMKYHLSLASHGGAFESLNFRKPSYSIYYPFVLNIVEKFDPKIIVGRELLQLLIIRKLPELSKIQSQDYKLPVYYKYNCENLLIKNILTGKYILNYLIRGRSLNYAEWIRSDYFKNFAKEIMMLENPLFEDVIGNSKEIWSYLLTFNKLHPWIFENIVKVKLMFDIIYQGDKFKYMEVMEVV